MNYQRVYDQIVARGKERFLEEYTERHHIVPRCMGGSDDPDNLVDLTPEEHYVCHQLLVKIHPYHRGLPYALAVMSKTHEAKTGRKMYGWLRRRISKEQFVKHCDHCGCEIKMTKYLFDEVKYPKRWCSRNCRTEAGNVTKPCRQCGELFTSKKHKDRSFCSHNCVWTYKKANQLFKICWCLIVSEFLLRVSLHLVNNAR